jgi:hypothetical protein
VRNTSRTAWPCKAPSITSVQRSARRNT